MLPKPQHDGLATDPSPRCLERYRVLREADEIGSVSEVCRRAGITRQTFYLWRKRYAVSGLLGLEDRPRKPSPGRPSSVNAAIMSVLIECVRRNPQTGCLSLSNYLAELGIRVSPPTVQKYLNRWRLSSQQCRAKWIRSGCPQIDLSGPSRTLIPPAPESHQVAKSHFFFGIPRRDGMGLEILRPSLAEVALALGIALADIQMMADREKWVESREMFLAQHQAEPPEREGEGSQVRSFVVERKAENSEATSWQDILLKAIASSVIARRGVKRTESEGMSRIVPRDPT